MLILYASLLEAVGIETAFVTVPGHIFIAFSLDIAPEQADRYFQSESELIFQNDNTWIPVEVTMVGTDFLDAWSTGAKQWREYSQSADAKFYPVHEAWKLYEPTGIKESGSTIEIPEEAKIKEIYVASMDQFIQRELQPQVDKLQQYIRRNGNDPRYINKLGALYARYGYYDKAESQFRQITGSARPYVPALINMGNICFLKDDLDEAKKYYQQAVSRNATSAAAYIGLAKVNYELGLSDEVQKYCAKAEEINPKYPDAFPYLFKQGEAGVARASSAQTKEDVAWEEE